MGSNALAGPEPLPFSRETCEGSSGSWVLRSLRRGGARELPSSLLFLWGLEGWGSEGWGL